MSAEQPLSPLKVPLFQPPSSEEECVLASCLLKSEPTDARLQVDVRVSSPPEADAAVQSLLQDSRQACEGSSSFRKKDEVRDGNDSSAAAAEQQLMKLFPEESRLCVKVTSNATVIRIPATEDILSALDLWQHKKLVLAWGLFFFLLVRFMWSMNHGIYPGYEPFRFGAVLFIFTVFRFSLKLTLSGALSEEEIHFEPQRVLVTRKLCCRCKTSAVDRCEILAVDATRSGVLIKCAGVGPLGFPKRHLVGRCVSLPEREFLAAFLRGYLDPG